MLNNIYKLKLFNFIFEVYNVTSTNSVNPTFIIITDVYPNVLFILWAAGINENSQYNIMQE